MNIILIGPQSSGKGTQAELLSKKLNLPVVVTGGILRKKQMEDNDEGRLIASFVAKGTLVPDELVDKIIREELEDEKYKDGVILDGYPRNAHQAEELERYFNVDKVIFLNVPDAAVVKRMSSRRVCSGCGAIFNLNTKLPKEKGKCDNCDGRLVQREDDTEQAIAVRLNIYHEETEPLMQHYEDQGKLLRIDGTKTIDEVYEEIKKELGITN
ncbi:adenylate kinase family protein [Patescibacteria group bacterium]